MSDIRSPAVPTPIGSQSQSHTKKDVHEHVYDPRRSTTSTDELLTFLRAPLREDPECIPGVGKVNKKHFAEANFTSTYQLMGKFLMFKGANCSQTECCDQFFGWLKSIGVNTHREAVVQAMAEKINLMCPGFYNEESYIPTGQTASG